MAAEARALAESVTGQDLPVTASDVPSLVAELSALGWGGDRIRGLRRERMEQRLPWPFPVAPELIAEVGFARFAALLADLRDALGVSGRLEASPAPSRVLNSDERRLVADRPPHWG